MLFHVFLQSSSFFHLAFSFYHFGELFAVVHRFCIASFDLSNFAHFLHSSSSFHRNFGKYLSCVFFVFILL